MAARKLTLGLAHRWRWWPPDGVVASDPTLSVAWPAGATTYTLGLAREPDTVTSISADRRVLTVTWGASGSAVVLASPDAPAAAMLVGIGTVEAAVRVVRAVTSAGGVGTVELAEPLPHPVTVSASPLTLHWHERSVLIPSVDMPAVPTRGIRWTVDYSAAVQGITVDYRRDRDVLHVVAMAFATHLSDADVLATFPDLRSRPQGSGSWRAQREASHDDLVALVRHRIAPRVEDVLPGGAFRRAHAYLTAAAIVEGTSAGGADRTDLAAYYRAQAVAHIDAQLALVDWSDVDGDGVVDAGETGVGATVSRATAGLASTLTDRSVVLYETDPAAPYEVPRRRVTEER
jgi:hypothetical protein